MKLEILPIERVEPAYILTVCYMIGDADGNTEKSIEFEELDEPLIKLIKVLNKLDGYTPKGCWGFIFNDHDLKCALSDGIITEEEAKFLDWRESEDWDDFLSEIIRDTYCDEREFLVYQGFDITYRDKDNCIHSVKIIDL